MGCWPAGPGSRQLGTCFQPQKNACLLGHFLSFQIQKIKLFSLQLNCFPGLNIEIRERAPQILGLGQFGRMLLSLCRSPQEAVMQMLGWEVTRLGIHLLFFAFSLWGSLTLIFLSLAEACIVCGSCACAEGGVGAHRALKASALTTGCISEAEFPLLGKSPFTRVFCACFELQDGEGDSEHHLKHPGKHLATVPWRFAPL